MRMVKLATTMLTCTLILAMATPLASSSEYKNTIENSITDNSDNVQTSDATILLLSNSAQQCVPKTTVTLELSNAPHLNQTAELAVSLSALENIPIVAEIFPSDGFVFASGENRWKGVLESGNPINLRAVVKSVSTGKFAITALVKNLDDQIVAKDSVYLYVAENFAKMRKNYSYTLELENKSFPVPENFAILEEENSHSSGNSSRLTGQINAPRMDGSIGPLRGAKVEFYFPDWPYNRVV
ncbi:MAG: hypothetical protein AB1305_02870 [Candidatus Hadarchaeota archaeon]